MKRFREDSSVGPCLKRPAIASGECGEPEEPALEFQEKTTDNAVPEDPFLEFEKKRRDDALCYLLAVRETFSDDKSKYVKLLETLNRFKTQRLGMAGVVSSVKELLRGHHQLLMGFNRFLPEPDEIKLEEETLLPPKKQHVMFDHAVNHVNNIKTRFEDEKPVYKAFLEILKVYREGNKSISEVYQEVEFLFRYHPDLLEEFHGFLPESSGPGNTSGPVSSKPRIKREEKNAAITSATHCQSERTSKRQKVGPIHMDHDGDSKPGIDHSAFKGGKEQHRKMEKEREKNFKQEHQKVIRVEKEYEMEDDLDAIQRLPHKLKPAHRADKLIHKQSKVKEGAAVSGDMALAADKKRENEDGEKDKQRDREREMGRVGSHHLKEFSSHKTIPSPLKERSSDKSMSELDFSDRERCTPSYCLLLKNYPRPLPSCRTELGATVLNDDWVSVTFGSKDHSFKHMQKNQYEETMSSCEDDRFEMDLLLESTANTADRLGVLAEIIADFTKPKFKFSVDKHLSVINRRCIERIYGNHGLGILDLLQKNPLLGLPLVHARLKQKHEEWLKYKCNMNRVWAEVHSRNHHKSLDHRSFYFKQHDEESLSTKGLLNEIKEINEKKRKEDNKVLLIAVGNSRPLIPDLKFEYPDPSIHEDLYQIVKYSADKLCNTTEQYDKVMRIWTTFIEPLFGMSPLSPGAEDPAKAAALQASASKQSGSSSGESSTTGGAECAYKTVTHLPDAQLRCTASAAADEFPTATSRLQNDKMDAPIASMEGGASEHEPEGTANAENGRGDGRFMASLDYSLALCKPLAAYVNSVDVKTPSRDTAIFYGNEMFYILLRLHQTLYDRIHFAKRALAADAKSQPVIDASAPDPYLKFLRLLYDLLDGSADYVEFEDECREMIGIQSYVLFTLDKLIFKLVKQLQAIAGDMMASKFLFLHAYEKSQGSAGIVDSIYRANALILCEESIFRFEHKASPSTLAFQLMYEGSEKLEFPPTMVDYSFQAYLDDFLSSAPETERQH